MAAAQAAFSHAREANNEQRCADFRDEPWWQVEPGRQVEPWWQVEPRRQVELNGHLTGSIASQRGTVLAVISLP
jgi:hypothetical protein